MTLPIGSAQRVAFLLQSLTAASILCFTPAESFAQYGTVSDPTSSMFPNEAPGPEAVSVPEPDIGRKFILIGKTGVPFGTLVRLQGIVFDGETKGVESGPNLFVENVDGKARLARIRLAPAWGSDFDFSKCSGLERELQNGKRYELEGYETGGFTGIPLRASVELKQIIQSDDFHFATTFAVIKGKLLQK